MICKNCGANIGNKGKCEYCDTVYFEKLQKPEVVQNKSELPKQKNVLKEKPSSIWAKITGPTKFVCVMWTLCCISAFSQIETMNYISYIEMVLLGFLIYGGITQLISAKWKKRHIAKSNNQISQSQTRDSIWTKITGPTKFVSVIWAICCIIVFSEIETIGYISYIGLVLFGLLFYGGITQLISTKCKKRRIAKSNNQTSQSQIRDVDLSPRSYDQMDGYEFEFFCGEILEQSGFAEISVTKSPENQGIDMIAFKNGMKYGIQCKCSSFNIGLEAVQKAIKGKIFYECHAAAILTNRDFTASAKELAEKNDISLWGRDRLEKFINLHE